MNERALKVFIVDDDSFLLRMYSRKFKNDGFEVDTASGSQEALDKLENGAAPDIILLDVIMPGMDGLAMLKNMRERSLAEGALVIMLTNQGQSDDIDAAQEIGVDGYIVKATAVPSEVIEEVKRIYNESKTE